MTAINKMVEWLVCHDEYGMYYVNQAIGYARRLALEEAKYNHRSPTQQADIIEKIRADVAKSKLPGLNKVIVYNILDKHEGAK